MKKLLLALALAAPVAAFAENVAAGALEVRGATAFGFQSHALKDDASGNKLTVDNLKLDASAAYYVLPWLGVGLEVGYDQTKTKFTGSDTLKDTTWIVGPKVVLEATVAPKVSVFGEGMVGYRKLESDVTADGWGFGLGGGVKYFFTRSFSGDLGLNYQMAKLTDSASNKGTESNLTVGVGFSVYFNNEGGAHH